MWTPWCEKHLPKGCCLNPKGWCIGISSIQHPLEDPGFFFWCLLMLCWCCLPYFKDVWWCWMIFGLPKDFPTSHGCLPSCRSRDGAKVWLLLTCTVGQVPGVLPLKNIHLLVVNLHFSGAFPTCTYNCTYIYISTLLTTGFLWVFSYIIVVGWNNTAKHVWIQVWCSQLLDHAQSKRENWLHSCFNFCLHTKHSLRQFSVFLSGHSSAWLNSL